MPGLRRRLAGLDQRLFDRIAARESPLFDQVLPRLGAAADHHWLWLGIAALLASTGHERPQRAAAHGLADLTIASAIANLFAKRLISRPRPDRARVPAARRAGPAPVTTSFPSGRAASAAAFAAAVGYDLPVLAVPLGGLAAGVVTSRVVVGAHYPSDVLAGAALGIAVAGLTRRAVTSRSARRWQPKPSQRQRPQRRRRRR